jgi:ABC-type Fe3+ transport system permease subunit
MGRHAVPPAEEHGRGDGPRQDVGGFAPPRRGESARDIAMQCLIALLLSSPLNFIASRAVQSDVQVNNPVNRPSAAAQATVNGITACFWFVAVFAVVAGVVAIAFPSAAVIPRRHRVLRVLLTLCILTPLITLPVGFLVQ